GPEGKEETANRHEQTRIMPKKKRFNRRWTQIYADEQEGPSRLSQELNDGCQRTLSCPFAVHSLCLRSSAVEGFYLRSLFAYIGVRSRVIE
ncbi:MAG TPA: hypothetical protein VE641_02545, partial [Chthoniobacterales bacterium]|nr:hypothetical protein [Chthoniobacterales bacterium]